MQVGKQTRNRGNRQAIRETGKQGDRQTGASYEASRQAAVSSRQAAVSSREAAISSRQAACLTTFSKLECFRLSRELSQRRRTSSDPV